MPPLMPDTARQVRACQAHQVELHRHLCSHGGVTEGSNLMGSEDAAGVMPG